VDFAFSAGALGAKVIDSYVEGRDHVLLDHDVQAMSLPLPKSLENLKLSDTGITTKTGLAVVAVEQNGSVITDLTNLERLTPGSTLILFGTSEQERIFTKAFG
jgi:K+/H+ antiporter YhaU regulatory subunit KhtT